MIHIRRVYSAETRMYAVASLEVSEICDACTTTLPFHIPDGIRMVELHQGLRISYRLLLRHGDDTIDKVYLLAMSDGSSGGRGLRSKPRMQHQSIRKYSKRL